MKSNLKIIKAKRILLSPLNWGIGHAARMVPIAQHLHERGAIVFICASGAALKLMQMECSYAQFVEDVPFEITYGKSKWGNAFKMFMQLPGMWLQIFREHQLLKKLVVQYQIDALISDNRYGFYHHQIPCVFITHQLQIQVPFGKSGINLLNHYFIKKYTSCWVPDWKENDVSIAGLLSKQKELKNVLYIGPLSRATKVEAHPDDAAPILYLLSGVEPQRSIFEEIILQLIVRNPHKAILVRGTETANNELQKITGLTVYNLIDSAELQKLVDLCKFVVSRSGYSTIMDMIHWQKNAVFVPTPGQFEQEYLADYLGDKKWFYTINQNDFLEFKEEDYKEYKCPQMQIVPTDYSKLLLAIM